MAQHKFISIETLFVTVCKTTGLDSTDAIYGLFEPKCHSGFGGLSMLWLQQHHRQQQAAASLDGQIYNNASHHCHAGNFDNALMPFMLSFIQAFIRSLQDNLATSFNVLKVGAPALAEAGGGNIACVGAAAVCYGMKNHEAWAACKGAVEGEAQGQLLCFFQTHTVCLFC
jgi:hypothetical protein